MTFHYAIHAYWVLFVRRLRELTRPPRHAASH
jgi:hypothetical protein